MVIDFWNRNGGGGSGSGSTGPQGPIGPQGPQGAEGAQGPKGEDGKDGVDGAQGPQGATGAQGPAGTDGKDGKDGADGPQGPAGANGQDGAQGPEGPQGPQGENGINQDPTKVKAVSQLPESADTGDVVAFVEPSVIEQAEVHSGIGGSDDLVWKITDYENNAGVQQVILANYTNDYGSPSVFGISRDYYGWVVFAGATSDPSEWISNSVVMIQGQDGSEKIAVATYNGAHEVYSVEVDGTWYIVGPDFDADEYIIPVELQSSVSVKQYDGSDWVEVGSGAYKIELSTNNPEDFTQEDIDNLNAFFAAVEVDPSIADSVYLYCSGDDSIYRCTYVYYDSENSGGQFEFVYPTAYAITQITIEFESGEYSEATINFLESNVLTIGDLPENPYVGMIANYNDGQGNIGLYRYDGNDWVPFGGGGSGSQGPQGPEGPQGPAGQNGANGSQGPQGETGAQGPQGPAGSGGGGTSYIPELEEIGIRDIDANGVAVAFEFDGEDNPTKYAALEIFDDTNVYLNTYEEDGSDWVAAETKTLAIMDTNINIVCEGINYETAGKIVRFDIDNDSEDLAIGEILPIGEGDSDVFAKERSIVTSTDIKRIVKISESGYEDLVNNDEVDEYTFYIVVADGSE